MKIFQGTIKGQPYYREYPDAKKSSEITHAEWILFNWIDVSTVLDKEPIYIRGRQRPLDEAMKLSGGSIETLKPYLWVLKDENQ